MKSVKGKVILGFVVGCAALGASWVISKVTFSRMQEKVDQLSRPNEKLRLVNIIFRDILLLNQSQNDRASGAEDKSYESFAEKSGQLQKTLDTLAIWCADSPVQVARIDSIRKILKRRENTFKEYVKVRTVLVSNRDIRSQADSISGLLITSAENSPDSTVIKTERKTTTTTIIKDNPDLVAAQKAKSEEQSKKGLFSKIFKSKKGKEDDIPEAAPIVVQKEEVNILIDTLTLAKNDSVIQKVGEEVRNLAKKQIVRTSRFVERERQLLYGENMLIGQLMEVMRDIETGIIDQMNAENQRIKATVSQSVNQIGMMILGVFSLSVLLAYLIFADITQSGKYRRELELAKEEAEYHSQAKQRFLSNMSHEIRTPLQSIIGYTELVRGQKRPGKEELEIISKSSEHLLYLVNEILDYSRIISDQFEFADESFHLASVMEDVVSIFRPEASRKQLLLAFTNEFAPDTYVTGDAFRLKQILYNLVGNAIKFTHEGRVDLVASRIQSGSRDEICLEVRDTGIGLSGDQVKRVFNQFEQGHTGIASQYGGTGLGLSIVHALVTGQGGRMQVKSQPGEGSSFIVFLPYRPGDVSETEVAADIAIRELDYRGKVWIVDDDQYILEWISMVLDRYHVRYKRFSSGIETLNQPWDPEVTLVLADMRMPGMTGAELCQRLRMQSGESVRYYACTAMAMPDEKVRIMEMGFDGVLMKPFKSSDILRILQGANPLQVESPASGPLDLSALSAMTMGDEQLFKDSLGQFMADTRSDLREVRAILENGQNRQQLRELFHKMAGRTGQVGAVDLGIRMRHLELSLTDAASAFPEKELQAIMASAEDLLDQIAGQYQVI